VSAFFFAVVIIHLIAKGIVPNMLFSFIVYFMIGKCEISSDQLQTQLHGRKALFGALL